MVADLWQRKGRISGCFKNFRLKILNEISCKFQSEIKFFVVFVVIVVVVAIVVITGTIP